MRLAFRQIKLVSVKSYRPETIQLSFRVLHTFRQREKPRFRFKRFSDLGEHLVEVRIPSMNPGRHRSNRNRRHGRKSEYKDEECARITLVMIYHGRLVD